MASLRDLKKLIRNYHIENKKALKKNVNNLWRDVYKLFKGVEAKSEVSKETTPTEHLNKKHCKYCNLWVNLEEYNLAEEICYKCYNENIEDEGGEQGNE